MKRTALLQEIRKLRFEEAQEGWQQGRYGRKKRPGYRGSTSVYFAAAWSGRIIANCAGRALE